MADNMKSLQEILAKRTDFYGEYPQVSFLKAVPAVVQL